MGEIIERPGCGGVFLPGIFLLRHEQLHQAVPQTFKGRFMEKLSADDALEARRLADQLGLRKLSDHDLVEAFSKDNHLLQQRRGKHPWTMNCRIQCQRKCPIEQQGIKNYTRVFYNPINPQLYEQAFRRQEGLLARLGPLVVHTGQFTGRAPNDKFIVKEPSSADHVWWGEVNRPFPSDKFDHLHHRMLAYMQGKEIYVQDCYAGADPKYRVPVRVVTEMAWQSMFARNMFIRIYKSEILAAFKPEYTVLAAPHFQATPELDETRSQAFILVHFGKKLILIGGTGYGGEIKKSIFTMMNYVLPHRGVLPMHCSANVGREGNSAIFFRLSGTGKTSLSADPDRQLVGDDEHGWSKDGIFNFEGG